MTVLFNCLYVTGREGARPGQGETPERRDASLSRRVDRAALKLAQSPATSKQASNTCKQTYIACNSSTVEQYTMLYWLTGHSPHRAQASLPSHSVAAYLPPRLGPFQSESQRVENKKERVCAAVFSLHRASSKSRLYCCYYKTITRVQQDIAELVSVRARA